jgi:hypothetical protein
LVARRRLAPQDRGLALHLAALGEERADHVLVPAAGQAAALLILIAVALV